MAVTKTSSAGFRKHPARQETESTSEQAAVGIMMSKDEAGKTPENERIPVTLDLEPEVYEFFHRKAQAAGVSIEYYLCSTLSIVLGCKAFSKMSPCTPDAEKPSCPENC